MYETYFNLAERPFASVPRSDHYYPAGVIDAARNTLTRCIDRGEGVGLLVGPPGAGKSLLCRVLADYFQKTFQVVLLGGAHLNTRRSLLQAMLYELHRPYRDMDEGELRLSLIDYIALNDDCEQGVLLLVDEAHHLPLRLLDELRTLTNLTRHPPMGPRQPAVRMVLAGNHTLEERFASPKLDSFSQRISARCYLEAFQREETQAYVWARILMCGGRGAELFPADTCHMVHKATGGVPRLINQVCDHVLLLAYAAGVRRIEPAHIEEAWADLQQLPTPWNEPAAAPSGDGVIEFGGLDDSPAEAPPIAGKISGDRSEVFQPTSRSGREASGPEPQDGAEGENELVARPTSCAADVAESPAEVAETRIDEASEQLNHIRQLLDDVRAEFQPAADEGPEVELVFENPHPFAEPFEDEELIADRYTPAAPAARAAQTVAFSLPPAPTGAPAAATVLHVEPPHEPTRAPRDRSCGQDDAPSEAAAEHLIAIAENRPAKAVVPPPKKLGRLFAGLRRGL